MRAALMILLAAAAARADGFRQVTTPGPQGEAENLIEGDVVHGGYGGPRVAYGRVAGHDAIQVGGEGGWIVNHHFILGGAGYGLATNQPAPGDLSATRDLTMGYGGVMLGYTLMPQKVVHLTFTTLVGAGGLGTRSRLTQSDTNLGDSFFVLEPTATVDVNVARYFRVGAAVSYRWVTGVETSGIASSDLSGVFGSMVLKFGKF